MIECIHPLCGRKAFLMVFSSCLSDTLVCCPLVSPCLLSRYLLSDLQTQVTLRSSRTSETRDCQSGFNLLNALESGFHGDSGPGDIALHVSEHIARLVILNDGEFSRG
jgi:hypothetical protein